MQYIFMSSCLLLGMLFFVLQNQRPLLLAGAFSMAYFFLTMFHGGFYMEYALQASLLQFVFSFIYFWALEQFVGFMWWLTFFVGFLLMGYTFFLQFM